MSGDILVVWSELLDQLLLVNQYVDDLLDVPLLLVKQDVVELELSKAHLEQRVKGLHVSVGLKVQLVHLLIVQLVD